MLQFFKIDFPNSKILGLIALFVFAVYGKTIFFDEYVLDDHLYVEGNSFVKRGLGCAFGTPDRLSADCIAENFKNIWGNDVLVGFFNKQNTGGLEGGRLRPLSLYTFAIEYEFFGEPSPQFSHFVNLILYSLVCLVIFLWLRFLFDYFGKAKELAFVVTLLFLVHPLHVEVVANIKGRMELMSALFSFLFALNITKGLLKLSVKNIVISAVFLFLGLLSKEEAITFLAIVPFFVLVSKRPFAFKNYTSLFLIAIPLATYFVIRSVVFPDVINSTKTDVPELLLNNPFLHADFNQKWGTILYTFWRYFELLFVPHPLTHDYYPYHIPLVDFTNPKALLGFGLVIISGIGFFKYLKKSPLISFGILFFWATFSITSNVFFNVGAFMNERFMFLPSLGFLLIIALLSNRFIDKLKTQQKQLFVLGIAIVFGALSFNRSSAWESNFTLFKTDVKVSHRSIKSNMEYAENLIGKAEKTGNVQLLKKAQKYLQTAHKIDTTFVGPFDLSGKAYFMNKKYNEAAQAYLEAVQLSLRNHQNPSLFRNNFYLSLEKALDAKQVGDFEKLMQIGTQLFPAEVKNYAYLGRFYGEFKQNFNESLKILEEGLKLYPDDAYLLKFTFINYATLGQVEKARSAGMRAYLANQNDTVFLTNLSAFYRNIGDFKNVQKIENQLQTLQNR